MSSDDGPRGPSKASWEPTAYVMDPYLGLSRGPGADARKTGEEVRVASGQAEATLLPKKSRKTARPAMCQVDGCGRDLSGEKAYLQRYSVCDVHFKADVALVHGQEMRFCQQCNKFQDLREFESVRRSCAARSKDRNLRRRLQTTLQKGVTTEEVLIPAAAMQAPQQQHQQSGGSPDRSGAIAAAGGGAGASDDSGGRLGSGDASMGGSAAMAHRAPEVGSVGSEYSLDAMGAAGLAMTAGGARRGGHPLSGCGMQVRNLVAGLGVNPQLAHEQQPTGSAGNGGGASSGNADVVMQEAPGSRAGVWGSLEQVGQSYEADVVLSPSLVAALARRGTATGDVSAGDMGVLAGDCNGPMLSDLDGFLPAASSNPYPSHASRHHQAGGPLGAALTLEGSAGTSALREQDSSAYARKHMSSVGTGAGGWAGPAALSLLDAYDGIRPQQQNSHHVMPNLQQQQYLHQPTAAVHRGFAGTAGTSGLGSWGSGTAHRLHTLGDGNNSGLGGQQQQLTLGGCNDHGSAAMLLEQLQGAVTGSAGRGAFTAAREEGSLAGLLGASGMRAGGGNGLAVRCDQSEGQRGSSAFAGRAQQHQQHHQAGGMPSLQSAQPNPWHDDLTAMIKERRAALIRQQLLQQQHRQQQQQQQQQQSLNQQQNGRDALMRQDHLSVLASAYNGDGRRAHLSASEQLQLRMLGADGSNGPGGGPAPASGTGSLDDFHDMATVFGPRGGAGGVNGALDSLGVGRLMGAGSMGDGPQGSLIPLGTAAEGMGIGRRQLAADPALDTVQLLEQYALGGGGVGGPTMTRLGTGVVNGAHLGFGAGGGSRGIQQHSSASGAGGGGSSGDGGGGYSRYDSGDPGGVGAGGGGAGFATHGTGDCSNGLEASGGGGSSRLLSVLYPGAGGREDALAARVCLKLFSCMPEELPGDMLLRLRRWAMAADSDVLQIFMRPGCVHIIVNMRLSRGSQAMLERCVLGGGDLNAAVASLRGAFDSSGLLRGRRVVVQAAEGPRGAFSYDGAAGGEVHWVSDADLTRAASVVAIQPAALTCGASTEVALIGRNLRRPGTRFYARCGGCSYVLRPKEPQPRPPAAGNLARVQDTAAAADAAPSQLCSPCTPPADEGVRGSWTDGFSAPSAPTSFQSGVGSCEDAPPLLYGPSDALPRSWASPDSERTREDCGRSSAALLLEDPYVEGEGPSPGSGPNYPQQAVADIREAGGMDGESCVLLSPQCSRYLGLCPGSDLEVVVVEMTAISRHGLLAVEAVSPDVDVMGAWAPGLVCQDRGAAAEINTWLQAHADSTSGPWLLKELGVLLDYDAVMPSLLQETAIAAFAGPPRRAEGWGMPHVTGAGAGQVPAMTVRGGHQRALQQKHATYNTQQQQQQLQQALRQPVMPVASNPLPRSAAETDSMGAAAGVRSGALSAVPYSASDACGLAPIVSARPDGSLELRLLASDTQVPVGSNPRDPSEPRHDCTRAVPGSTGDVGFATAGAAAAAARSASQRLQEGDAEALPHASSYVPTALEATRANHPRAVPSRLTLSDDTKVPDAPGRLLEASFRRLLAHPLLHPGCRRAMLSASARLLSFAVATGLRILANGLLEWMIALEGPGLGLASGEGPMMLTSLNPRTGSLILDSEPTTASALADAYGRVVARAAVATVHGAVVGACRGADGRYGAGGSSTYLTTTTWCGSLPDKGSSHDSSVDSSGNEGLRNLSTGLTLLHLAVVSGSSEMLVQVLDWADEYGRPWSLEVTAWPGRVTAFHLAAAAAARPGDRGEAARLLLSLGPEAQDAWFRVRDASGRTAADIAHALGLDKINYFCLYGEEVPAAAPAVPAPAAAASKEAACGALAPEESGGGGGESLDGGASIEMEKAEDAKACGRSQPAVPKPERAEDVACAVVPLHFLLDRSAARRGIPLLLGALLVLLLAVALRGL